MARSILGGAIVPAAPALLPEVSHAQPGDRAPGLGELRATLHETLARLPDADVVVAIDTGPRGIHQRTVADLGQLGLADVRGELPTLRPLLAQATRLTQYPLVQNDRLDVSASVLALLVRERFGEIPFLLATTPAKTQGEMLAHVGAGLVEAVRAIEVTGVVIASGDLSAALGERSPRWIADGAAEWDAGMVTALREGDAAALQDLGPDRAAGIHARSWAAIAAASGAFGAARLQPAELHYAAPLGVGQLVGRFAPASPAEPGERFRRRGPGP